MVRIWLISIIKKKKKKQKQAKKLHKTNLTTKTQQTTTAKQQLVTELKLEFTERGKGRAGMGS